MKLLSVDITGFRGLNELHCDFDPQLTVLVGENGVGKTSVLDALAILLDQFLARYVRNSPQSAKKIKAADVSADLEALTFDSTLRLQADVGRSSPLTWVVESALPFLRKQGAQQGSDFNELNAYIKSKSDEDKKDSFAPPLIVFFGQKRAVLDVPARILSNADLEPRAAFEKALDAKLDFREFVAWFRDRSLLEAQHWRENAGYRDTQLEAVRQAMTQATGLADPEYKMAPSRGLYVRKRSTILRVDQFSSGEKSYLALVGDLARRLALLNPESSDPLSGTGIVLIDEVELHLHPKWQRDFLPFLLKTFPKCQFIVTTHSPQVLGEIRADSIRILRVAADGRVDVVVPSATYGRDSNYILLSVLGADERDRPLKDRLDALDAAIAGGRLDEASTALAALRQEMEGEPPELTIAQARLERRERSRGK
ncbi:MAG: AAA family ATPase [Desulfuromonadaceae bacterium]